MSAVPGSTKIDPPLMEPLGAIGEVPLGLLKLVGYALILAGGIAVYALIMPFVVVSAFILTVMARKENSPPPLLYCPMCLSDDQPVLSLLRIRLVRSGSESKDLDGTARLSIAYYLDCERGTCSYEEVYSFEEFGRIYRGKQ